MRRIVLNDLGCDRVESRAQILPGTLDLLILRALSLKPQHSYGVVLRIGQISNSGLVIEQGGLPASYRLVRKGSLKAAWSISDSNQRAEFYELTAAGRKRLRQKTEGWNRPIAAIGSVLSTRPEQI